MLFVATGYVTVELLPFLDANWITVLEYWCLSCNWRKVTLEWIKSSSITSLLLGASSFSVLMPLVRCNSDNVGRLNESSQYQQQQQQILGVIYHVVELFYIVLCQNGTLVCCLIDAEFQYYINCLFAVAFLCLFWHCCKS